MIDYLEQEFRGDLLNLIRKMDQAGFRPDFIAGVSRGGLIPGVFLSQWFDCPFLVVKCSLRDQNQEVDVSDLLGKEGVLLIDDIVDTGESFKRILEKIPGTDIKTAALWFNSSQNIEVDFWAREINRTDDVSWINFPWERWWMNP